MNEKLRHIFEIYKQGRYKIISEKIIEVDDKTVTNQIKSGRNILTCDCTNHTRFCKTPVFCRHKLFFLYFPFLELLDSKLNELRQYYSTGESMVSTRAEKRIYSTIKDDLDSLRRFNFLK